MNKLGKGFITFWLLILIAVVIWGLVGSEKTKEIGINCDLGWKSSLCWKWENSTDTMKEKGDEITGMVIDKIKPIIKNKTKTIIIESLED